MSLNRFKKLFSTSNTTESAPQFNIDIEALAGLNPSDKKLTVQKAQEKKIRSSEGTIFTLLSQDKSGSMQARLDWYMQHLQDHCPPMTITEEPCEWPLKQRFDPDNCGDGEYPVTVKQCYGTPEPTNHTLDCLRESLVEDCYQGPHLSMGAIAAITVGSVAGTVLLFSACFSTLRFFATRQPSAPANDYRKLPEISNSPQEGELVKSNTFSPV